MIAEDEGTSSPEGYFAGMFLRRREKFLFFFILAHLSLPS